MVSTRSLVDQEDFESKPTLKQLEFEFSNVFNSEDFAGVEGPSKSSERMVNIKRKTH